MYADHLSTNCRVIPLLTLSGHAKVSRGDKTLLVNHFQRSHGKKTRNCSKRLTNNRTEGLSNRKLSLCPSSHTINLHRDLLGYDEKRRYVICSAMTIKDVSPFCPAMTKKDVAQLARLFRKKTLRDLLGYDEKRRCATC